MWTWGQSRWSVDTAWAPSFTTTATGSSIVPYVDLNTIHNPATGTVAPAAWGDQVRDNLEFLIDPPACSVFATSAQSVASSASVQTDLTAAGENFDNDAMHSTVTNTARITCKTAGRYLVTATVQFDGADMDGERIMRFEVNATTVYVGMRILANQAAGNFPTILTTTRSIVMAVNDFVTCQVRQNSGSSLDVVLIEFAATFLTR